MKIKKPGNEEIAKAKDNKHIIGLTGAQIAKDFALFGMDISFSGDVEMAYFELRDQIHKNLEPIIDTQFEKLRALLYQIDIPENKIKKELHGKDRLAYPLILSDLIIERELKKVLLREYFKQVMKEE